MTKTCTVGGCKSNSARNRDVSFLSFPKDNAVRSKWIAFVKKTRRDYKFSVWSFICSKHFTVDCKYQSATSKVNLGVATSFKFMLKKGSVPTLKTQLVITASRSRACVPVSHRRVTRTPSSTPAAQKRKSNCKTPLNKGTSATPSQRGTSFHSIRAAKLSSSLASCSTTQPRETRQYVGKCQGTVKQTCSQESCVYIRLTSVNQYIICHLCGGYLVDATTITECLHTFCKSCLVTYVRKHDLCPTCDTLIHPSNPHLSLKLDPTIQDIVYKFLPYIQKDEAARQRRFWKELNLEAPKEEVAVPEPAVPKVVEPHVAVVLEYAGANVGCPTIEPLQKKFILVPSRVTVRQVQKFITLKLHLESLLEVDIVCDEEILEPDVTLKEIWTQSTEDQMADGMLCLYYSITSSQEEPR